MKKKIAFAVLFWALMGLWVLLGVILPADVVKTPMLIYTTGFIILFAIFAWFLEDAAELGFKPSAGLKLGVILTPFIAVPYYRFKHTGFKKGLLFIARIVGIYIAIIMSMSVLLADIGF
jgi:hypothetical protein